MSPFSPAKVHAPLRRATSFQAIRPYLGRRLELMTRPPSEAVDLTDLIPHLHEQVYHIGDLQLARIVLLQRLRR
jgi:hypothetical protein